MWRVVLVVGEVRGSVVWRRWVALLETLLALVDITLLAPVELLLTFTGEDDNLSISPYTKKKKVAPPRMMSEPIALFGTNDLDL